MADFERMIWGDEKLEAADCASRPEPLTLQWGVAAALQQISCRL
jgi:hypothetical protein